MNIYDAFKDALSIAQKADNVDLYRKLLDLSAQALDLQEENARIKAENTELRKGREIASKICRHHSPYLTLLDDAQQIKYCAICWGSDNKLMQMRELNSGGEKTLYCHKCGNSCRLDK